jgi:RNA polymerase sigma-70 factor, ECF subfamily
MSIVCIKICDNGPLMDERELIRKSLKGEEGAFDLLVQQNQAKVYRHCLGIVKDEEIAQDLTQETFVHAFQHLPSFRMEARFSTWLWRIAHNLSLNYLKRHRHYEQEFKEELLLPKFLKKEEVNDELMLKIQQAMQHLSPKQLIVFEMYDLRHIPQKEIAASLGISLGTVRSRLFYARKKIKRFLQEV